MSSDNRPTFTEGEAAQPVDCANCRRRCALPTRCTPAPTCRGLLAQYSPQRLLVVAEAQEYGIAKASQPVFEQVGAGCWRLAAAGRPAA